MMNKLSACSIAYPITTFRWFTRRPAPQWDYHPGMGLPSGIASKEQDSM